MAGSVGPVGMLAWCTGVLVHLVQRCGARSMELARRSAASAEALLARVDAGHML